MTLDWMEDAAWANTTPDTRTDLRRAAGRIAS